MQELRFVRLIGLLMAMTGCNGLPDLSANDEIKKSCVQMAPVPTVSISISTATSLPNFLSAEIDGATPFIDECNTPFEPGATLLRDSSTSARFITASVSDYLDEFGDPLPNTKMSVKAFGRDLCSSPQIEIFDIVDAPINWGLYEVDIGDCRYKVWKGVVQ